MDQSISKSQFKPHALKYMRQVEVTKTPITITHFGKPVIQIIPADPVSDQDTLHSLHGSVTKYDNPLAPVGLDDRDALK